MFHKLNIMIHYLFFKNKIKIFTFQSNMIGILEFFLKLLFNVSKLLTIRILPNLISYV